MAANWGWSCVEITLSLWQWSSTIALDQSATLAPDIVNAIQALSLTQLENLGEALLAFEQVSDLEEWLRQNG